MSKPVAVNPAVPLTPVEEARAKFLKAIEAARKEMEAVTFPAWDVKQRALVEAKAEYTLALKEIEAAYVAAIGPAHDTFEAVRLPALLEYEQVQRAAGVQTVYLTDPPRAPPIVEMS